MTIKWVALLKSTIALIALAVAAQHTVLLPATLKQDPLPYEFAFDGAPPELLARRKNILEEAKKPGVTEWAGRYYAEGGEDTNRSLLWSPTAGYILRYYMDAPIPYDLSVGRAAIEGERLRLYPQVAIPVLPNPSYRDTLNLVRWGKRHYLAADSDMVAFCCAINSTAKGEIDRFLLKSEEVPDPTGYPDVPAKYHSYLRNPPITVAVMKVESDRIAREHEYPEYRVKVIFNAGAKQGVRVGMAFWLASKNKDARLKFRVGAVHETTSEAELFSAPNVDNYKSNFPRIGTRYRNRPKKDDDPIF